jgi:hypothetical protein
MPITSMFQNTGDFSQLEYYMKSVNNPDILPEFGNRINKYENTLDILIKQYNSINLYNDIITTFSHIYNL